MGAPEDSDPPSIFYPPPCPPLLLADKADPGRFHYISDEVVVEESVHQRQPYDQMNRNSNFKSLATWKEEGHPRDSERTTSMVRAPVRGSSVCEGSLMEDIWRQGWWLIWRMVLLLHAKVLLIWDNDGNHKRVQQGYQEPPSLLMDVYSSEISML